jgi:hypothetical protein
MGAEPTEGYSTGRLGRAYGVWSAIGVGRIKGNLKEERTWLRAALVFIHPLPFSGIRCLPRVKSGTRSGRDRLGDNGEGGCEVTRINSRTKERKNERHTGRSGNGFIEILLR